MFRIRRDPLMRVCVVYLAHGFDIEGLDLKMRLQRSGGKESYTTGWRPGEAN